MTMQMTEATNPRSGHIWRSSGAVLIGFVVGVALSLGTDQVLPVRAPQLLAWTRSVGGGSPTGALLELSGEGEDVLVAEVVRNLAHGQRGFEKKLTGSIEASLDDELLRR
jgi:hypothetical protein